MRNKTETCATRTLEKAMAESDLIESKTKAFLEGGGVIDQINNNIGNDISTGAFIASDSLNEINN